MEHDHDHDHDHDQRRSYGHHHIARKLNFNAPLLTTRRPAANVGIGRLSISGSTTSDRVPFCWEQAPGKPKDYVERCHDVVYDSSATTPRPTLPPRWWRPPIQTKENTRRSESDDNLSESDYVLSDVVDVFSLSEAIDIVEKAEKDLKLNELNLYREKEEEEEGKNVSCKRSSNFMIERFLPDATALAASSVLNRHAFSPQRVGGRPFSPPKGCGLDMLFPWRIKHHHRLCGVRSPVRDDNRRVGSKSSVKQKKHII
ncbi:uncharacterized protein LOC111804477 [Cucurbita pepo subsp. pepo]|uniref:uncharacterized protein LOC111804477 n=1 Tax=Cucurbita pepo subsp. pepo TaxID=3664 RepID=UPI000C9D79E3|nr:uncharacterized protein LOC111804477 [Cucurbita pepo subsp. pepo]